MLPHVYRAIFARNVHCCKTLAISNDSHQKPVKHIVRVQLIEASVCVFWWIVVLFISLPKRPPTLCLRPPTEHYKQYICMDLQTHTFMHTHSAGQVGAVVREMVFHLSSWPQESRGTSAAHWFSKGEWKRKQKDWAWWRKRESVFVCLVEEEGERRER